MICFRQDIADPVSAGSSDWVSNATVRFELDYSTAVAAVPSWSERMDGGVSLQKKTRFHAVV